MDGQRQEQPRVGYEGSSRKSLPLTPKDRHKLSRLRDSPDRRAALADLVGTGDQEQLSEAQLLHAVFLAGLRAVEERLAEESYAAEAVERRAESAKQRASDRRRRPYWADEP